jgi:hypothetical protein
MQVRNHGKYTKMSMRDPRGIARCDYSGLMVRHSDLQKQKQYRGRGLVWTGLMVAPQFADVPNPQDLIPLIKLDPVPLNNPRTDSQVDAQMTIASSTGEITIDVSDPLNRNLTLENAYKFNNGIINFTGILTEDIIVVLPATYNQFYANNLTTGGFEMGFQLVGNTNFTLNVPPADPVTMQGPMVVNTSLNLQIVYF